MEVYELSVWDCRPALMGERMTSLYPPDVPGLYQTMGAAKRAAETHASTELDWHGSERSCTAVEDGGEVLYSIKRRAVKE